MLSQEAIKKIEKILKLSGLDELIKDPETKDISIPEDLHVFTDAEVTVLKNNEYKSGKEKGVEMAIKDTKEKLSLEFSGKTIDGLVEAYGKKVIADAKLKPDEKVTELEGKIKTLQTTVQDYEGKLSEKDSEVNQVKVNGELFRHIPKLGDNAPALDQDDIITMMKSKGYDFKLENGALVTTKDGTVLQDKLSNPLSAKEVVDSFLKEKKLIVEEGVPRGRGGNSSQGQFKAGKLSELKKQFEANGKSLLGEEFNNAVTAATKANPEFDLNS